MNSISDKTIQAIKERHIAPVPRWQFTAKHYFVWVAILVCSIIGSLAFSITLFELVNNDWEVLEYLHKTVWQHIAYSLPVFWLVLLTVFILLAYYNVRHARGTYRYRAWWLVLGSVFISIGCGLIIYGVGLAPRLHTFADSALPFVFQLTPNRGEFLTQPGQGVLAGEVEKRLGGADLYLVEDYHGYKWIIRPADNFISPSFPVITGEYIRLLGHISDTENNVFLVERILPYIIGPRR